MDNRTERLKYLRLLAMQYPNVEAASSEIIHLQAILSLPKGTEHFMSDLHGEAEAFVHILNNASGAVREKVDNVLRDSLPADERARLATLIYYPEEKLEELVAAAPDRAEWYRITLSRLLEICRLCASKYTREKVRRERAHDRVLGQQRGRRNHPEALRREQVVQLDERVLIRAAAIHRRRDRPRAVSLALPQPLGHERGDAPAEHRPGRQHHIVRTKGAGRAVRPAEVDFPDRVREPFSQQHRCPLRTARRAEQQNGYLVQHGYPSLPCRYLQYSTFCRRTQTGNGCRSSRSP